MDAPGNPQARREREPIGLHFDNVSKWFVTGQQDMLHVIGSVSFAVEGGEFVSVVGPSGCGKTTLLRLAHGLIPIDRGSVRVGATTVTDRPTTHAAMVFQDDLLLPWRTVMQNVLFPCELNGTAKDASIRERAQELLRIVGLEGFEDHYPHQLSGGMRQRTNLARALIGDPAVLLMDEPFAALDAQTREVLQEELLQVWDELSKTVLFITHQIDEAVFLSDRVVVMSARPGTVARIVDIELPRPRSLEEKRGSAALAYITEIWELIMQAATSAARR